MPAPEFPFETPATTREDGWPSPLVGWIAVLLLACTSIISQFDRTVINLAVGPIKAEYGLNDTHFGMLQGVAFGIFYVLACIPIGRMADRYQRRIILSVGIFFFSLFAMGSGLARSYTQLFLTRIGVGVGEASVTPAGLSMLSDLFPPERLGRPTGAFFVSAPLGQALAFIIGGGLLQWLATSPILHSGPLSGMQAWQAAFVIVGAPGLLMVPLLLLLREPARRGLGGADPMPMVEVLAVVRERLPTLIPMFAGFSMVTVVTYAFFIWTPALFQRTYGWTPGEIGLGFGLIVLFFGSSGAYFGGWASDWLAARGHLDAPLKVAAFGFVGCGLFGALAPMMPNAAAALVLLAPTVFFMNTPFACAGTALQLIIPNRARAQVTALYVTILTLVGLGIGPLVIGLMTDYLFPDPAGIRYSISIVVGIAAPLMCGLLLYARRPYRALRVAQLAEHLA